MEAPKRALQTPQREWLRGPLRKWAGELIERSLAGYGRVWLDANAVRREWRKFLRGESDNSFYVWQWISLALLNVNERRQAVGGRPPDFNHSRALMTIEVI